MVGKTQAQQQAAGSPRVPASSVPTSATGPCEGQDGLSGQVPDLAPDLESGLESPARRLQHYLGNELGTKFGEDVLAGRWSVRRTIGFVVVTCSLFWFILWLAIRAIF